LLKKANFVLLAYITSRPVNIIPIGKCTARMRATSEDACGSESDACSTD